MTTAPQVQPRVPVVPTSPLIVGHKFSEIAFAPKVKALQEVQGAVVATRFETGDDASRSNEAALNGARDSVHMATVSKTGWPSEPTLLDDRSWQRFSDIAAYGRCNTLARQASEET